MTVYNKLKTAILAIIASQSTHAILLDPVQIQSAPGELLYAEINFSQADLSTPMQVELASNEDLMGLNIRHQPPGNLNFFTRRTGQGNGVIVITSSRPVTESELNFVVKIKEGSATRLQHIKSSFKRTATNPSVRNSSIEKPLTPQIIVSEKDIALNLPVAATYTKSVTSTYATNNLASTPPALVVNNIAPPILNTPTNKITSSTSAAMATETKPAAQTSQDAHKNSASPLPATEKNTTGQHVTANQAVPAQALKKSTDKPPVKSPATEQPAAATPAKNVNAHTVNNNESLWSIASRIAAQTHQSIPEVMKEIQAKNQHAFIQGDANRLRRGAILNLAIPLAAKTPRNTTITPPPQGRPQSGKAKYRLNQAEMSLVAESAQDSAQGSAKKRTQQNQTSAELSLKVMTAREKTVKLQKNVTQLELALRQKDQRIQLLNARLAQLQQQLQQQQKAKKSIH